MLHLFLEHTLCTVTLTLPYRQCHVPDRSYDTRPPFTRDTSRSDSSREGQRPGLIFRRLTPSGVFRPFLVIPYESNGQGKYQWNLYGWFTPFCRSIHSRKWKLGVVRMSQRGGSEGRTWQYNSLKKRTVYEPPTSPDLRLTTGCFLYRYRLRDPGHLEWNKLFFQKRLQ